MNGQNLFDGFDFHDDLVLHEQIDAISQINRDVVVNHREWLFEFKGHPESAQFMTKAGLIRAFQQPRAELGMDPIGGAENIVGDAAVDQLNSVSFVRFRLLRGGALESKG